jgi:crossover junction endodeoxyribonuclease RuvC
MIVGIDPGKNGAVALLGDTIRLYKMPDFGGLSCLLEGCDFIVLEKVHSMPGQGVRSTFSFGMRYGMALEAVSGSGIPYKLVSPQTWKRQFSLTGLPKDAARLKAIELFPELREQLKLKKDVDKADALLLALYGRIALHA